MRIKSVAGITAALWMSALSSFSITSVSGGGSWGNTNTWIGHLIPTSSDAATSQTITFPAIADREASVVAFDPEVTASSGLTVMYTVVAGQALDAHVKLLALGAWHVSSGTLLLVRFGAPGLIWNESDSYRVLSSTTRCTKSTTDAAELVLCRLCILW